MAGQGKIVGDYTGRELRVIEMRAAGMRPEEIAKREGVSRRTIYQLMTGVYRKSGTRNTAELTEWAWFAGLDVPAPADPAEPASAGIVKPSRA